MATTTLDYLIPDVRLRIGDLTEPYRYLDAWLLNALIMATKNFQRYSKAGGQIKYLLDNANAVYRNTLYLYFETDEATSGVIEDKDEPILSLMAAIIVLEGSLESSAWNTVSWKDAEISFSNLESARTRSSMLDRLMDELDKLLPSPTKRLATPLKSSLPGYLNNNYERDTKL